VWHRGASSTAAQPVIICPVRFVQDKQIFSDASRLFRSEEDAEVVIIPEVSLPIGRIDYILTHYHKAQQQVMDYIILEVMTCSTTSTGEVLRSFHDILQGKRTERRPNYGINFRQVLSRMMVQVLAKAYACEKWNKRMVWAIQDVLYDYMRTTTKVELQNVPLANMNSIAGDMPILLFVYSMQKNEEKGSFELKLAEIQGGTKEGFARFLEPMEIPERAKVEELIQRKIQTSTTPFTLQTPLRESLAQVAANLVQDSLAETEAEE
jgi:hypothetical protein